MKKTTLVALLFFIIIGKSFTQSFIDVTRIYSGDLSIFSEDISDMSLAKMNNADLRLLRNMIYAKHGHIFKSSDLIMFYSQFQWYKAEREITDNDLSEKEIQLIKQIKIFESRDENKSTINFNDEINGVWHRSPIMPDTWLDRFVFNQNSEIAFLISNFIEDPEVSEYLGNYVIKGNTLLFYVNKLVKKHVQTDLSETIVLKFPITSITKATFMDGDLIRKKIQIGSFEFFLVPGDPRKG